jgi:hypothetical protein
MTVLQMHSIMGYTKQISQMQGQLMLLLLTLVVAILTCLLCRLRLLHTRMLSHALFLFIYLRGVSGPAYAHHDYSPRPTGHPASPGAGKAPRG